MAGGAAQVHHIGHIAKVDAIDKIPAAGLAMPVLVAYAAHVDFPHATLLEPSHALLYLSFLEIPEVGEVIHHAVGDNAQGYLIARLPLGLHQAVDGIVEGTVSSNDDDGLVAVVDKHLHQARHTPAGLALDEVVGDALILQHPLHARPAVVGRSEQAGLWAIKDAPPIGIYHLGPKGDCPWQADAAA